MNSALIQQTDGSLPPLATYFFQLGYVVSDLEVATETLGKSLGVTFRRAEGSAGPSDQLRYRGEPCTVSILLAFANLGGIEHEIIQPLSKPSLYTDFLDSHGAGLHHAGYKIPDHDQYQRYHRLLVANGCVPLMEGRVEKDAVEVTYFDCSACGGSVIEIVHFA